MNPQKLLTVAQTLKSWCHTHWVTVLGLSPTANPSPTLSGRVSSVQLNDHDEIKKVLATKV